MENSEYYEDSDRLLAKTCCPKAEAIARCSLVGKQCDTCNWIGPDGNECIYKDKKEN
jgi:hypothetical protein